MPTLPIPTQTSKEFANHLIDALSVGNSTAVSITSEAFYVLLYELIVSNTTELMNEDVKEFLHELADNQTLVGVPFTELHMVEEDAVAALVITPQTEYLLTLPKEYTPEIDVQLGETSMTIEVPEDTEEELDDARLTLEILENRLEEAQDEVLSLEGEVEDARHRLLELKKSV